MDTDGLIRKGVRILCLKSSHQRNRAHGEWLQLARALLPESTKQTLQLTAESLRDDLTVLKALDQRIRAEIAAKGHLEVADDSLSNDTGLIGKPLGGARVKRDQRSVCLISGRDKGLKRGLSDFLGALGLELFAFEQALDRTAGATPFVGEIIENLFRRTAANIVLWTPEDEARLKREFRTEKDSHTECDLQGQPRQNVIFEAGMAFALAPQRTIVLQRGVVRQISDLSGRHVLEIEDTAEFRVALRKRLEKAGCRIKARGESWQEAGRF